MREHDDEYLRGGGRRRSRLHHPPPPSAGVTNMDIHATDTIISGEGYVLGGRVNRNCHRAGMGTATCR